MLRNTAKNSEHISQIVKPFSILDAAKNIFANLKSQAAKMQSREEVESNLWLDDDYQREYHLTHSARLELKESGMPREIFYAAGQLIEDAVSISRSIAGVHKDLDVIVRQGSEDIEINAKYRSQTFQKRLAPVTKICFATIEKSIQQIINSLTSTEWKVEQPELLTRTFYGSTAQQNCNDCFDRIYSIQKICKELDKNFDMQIHNNSYSQETPKKITINKQQFDKACKLILTKNVYTATMNGEVSVDDSNYESKPSISSDSTIKILLSRSPVTKKMDLSEKPEMNDLPNKKSLPVNQVIENPVMDDEVVPMQMGGAPGGPSFY